MTEQQSLPVEDRGSYAELRSAYLELRAALEMIAGKRPCPDPLMSKAGIALAALGEDVGEPK